MTEPSPPTHHPIIKLAEVLRPTIVEVNLSQLSKNYQAIAAKVAPARVMPILKANAYGHGIVEVARHLSGLGVSSMGVAFLEEALLLREAGIQTQLLVMGDLFDPQLPSFLCNDLSLTVSSVEKLQRVNHAAQSLGLRARIHLKIDTGMSRIGMHYTDADTLIDAAYAATHCLVEGVFSHFATSDEADLRFAKEQLRRFLSVKEKIERRGVPRPVFHMANSGAILQLPESHLDMVRPGVLFYGVYPSAEAQKTIAVAPALSWRSRVVFVKMLAAHQGVSYGSTWQSDHPTRIATLPLGYGDGYLRCMSGAAQVLLRGKRYPVVGRICMDQCMVSADADEAALYDEVTLIGQDGGETITCEELARWANTIPYEILTNINTRVPRLYKRKHAA